MSAWTYRSSDGKAARTPERLFHLVLESHDGRAPGADSEEKHEPVSDIDTVVVDSLKALDPEWRHQSFHWRAERRSRRSRPTNPSRRRKRERAWRSSRQRSRTQSPFSSRELRVGLLNRAARGN